MPVKFICDECGSADQGTISRYGYGIKPENWKIALNNKTRVICPRCKKETSALLR